MLLRLCQNFVVRRRLVLVVVRLYIIFSHRMIFELIPHQNTAQVGMAIEDDPVQIEDLALLKFRTAPHRRTSDGRCTWSVRFTVRIRITTGPCFFSIE